MATRTKKTNGSILRSYRKANGYSIPQFAKMTNLGPATISRYERDVHVIPQVVVDYLNSQYDVSLKNTNKKATKNLRVYSSVSETESTKTVKTRKVKSTATPKVKTTSTSTILNRFVKLWKSQGVMMKDFASKYGFSATAVSFMKQGSLKYVPISALSAMAKDGIDLTKLFK